MDLLRWLAHFLHVDWLFPMSSAEVAAWLQGIGTVAAFMITSLALVVQGRQARRARLELEKDRRLDAASNVSGWLTLGVIDRGVGPGHEYLSTTAVIHNYSNLTARDLRAWVVNEGGVRISPSVRSLDSLAPRGDIWRLEWGTTNLDLVPSGATVELCFQFSLGVHRFLCDGRSIQESSDWSRRPETWNRLVSSAWYHLLHPYVEPEPLGTEESSSMRQLHEKGVTAWNVHANICEAIEVFLAAHDVQAEDRERLTELKKINTAVNHPDLREARRRLAQVEQIFASYQFKPNGSL